MKAKLSKLARLYEQPQSVAIGASSVREAAGRGLKGENKPALEAWFPLSESFRYETPLTLNTFQFCLNNPNVYVDPDGRDWFDSSNFMSGFSMKSMFDQAFKTDFGESSDRFMEKLPSRMAKVPGYLGEKGLEMGGDAVQAVPSSVYSGVSLATMVEAPYISAAANYLGGIKTGLDWKEGKISNTEAASSVLLMGASAANPIKVGALLGSPAPQGIAKFTDFIRNVPLFVSDLFHDVKFKSGKRK